MADNESGRGGAIYKNNNKNRCINFFLANLENEGGCSGQFFSSLNKAKQGA
jgi:hypothetical protein